MIKEIQIKNYKGIKELTTLNFELPHLKPSQIEKEPTFLIKDGVKAMATPILLAKNASGKTSILEAIEFADTINSFDDLFEWVTKDIETYRKQVDRAFAYNVRELKRRFSLKLKIKEVRGLQLKTIERIARDLNLGNIFDNNLFNDEITNEHLHQCQRKLEDRIEEEFKKVTNSSMNKFSNSLDNNMIIKIVFSNNEEKYIEISDKIIYNDTKVDLNDLSKAINSSIENSDLISVESYYEYNGYFLYAVSDPDWDESWIEHLEVEKQQELSGLLIEFKYAFKKNNIKNLTYLKARIVNDRIIRNEIQSNSLKNDWGGKLLVKNFIEYYGSDLSEKVIASIDNSISHIEKQNKNDLWVLKDKMGFNRAVSDLSFGTFKTIFILNEIYFAWKNKKILLIDEIENGLNMSLINLIVKFATNEKFAKDGFQVIFTTHNPLILSQNVINPQNAFINVSGTFERIIDNKSIIKRSEDLEKVFAPKNYYNEYFWLNSLGEKDKNSNTINRDDIFKLLDQVEESLL